MAKFPLETIRHSAAHVMAAAVQELYPDTKFDIGPSTEDGFYYDFDLSVRLNAEDLEKIEEKINEIIAQKLPFTRTELTREEAKIRTTNWNVWLIFRTVLPSHSISAETLPTSAAVPMWITPVMLVP